MIASPSQTPFKHSDPITGTTSEPPLPLFRPTGPKLEQLLSDLLNSYGSLHDVALNNNTTLAALTLWLAMPENQALLDQVESAGYRRARLTASNVLADAVNSLSCSLRGHVEIETKHCAHLDYTKIRIYERARVNARKAAWLLYRISRSHPALPIDAATHLKLEEARLERAKLKAQLKAQSNAQHKAQLSPSRGTAFNDAAFGRTTSVVQSGVPDQVPPVPSERSHHEPMPSGVDQLASIATALGIDISEFDDFEDEISTEHAALQATPSQSPPRGPLQATAIGSANVPIDST